MDRNKKALLEDSKIAMMNGSNVDASTAKCAEDAQRPYMAEVMASVIIMMDEYGKNLPEAIAKVEEIFKQYDLHYDVQSYLDCVKLLWGKKYVEEEGEPKKQCTMADALAFALNECMSGKYDYVAIERAARKAGIPKEEIWKFLKEEMSCSIA